MAKKTLNQNAKYVQDLIDSVEPDYIFSSKPLNRFKVFDRNDKYNKREKLSKLKEKINSIENCILKSNSKNLVMGYGNINSPIMIIGEAPGIQEDNSGLPFQGEVGKLLKKMLIAINIDKEKVYTTYSINFRPPEDRKPSSQEIRRYSSFLIEHSSIINPKIIILMGSTAMECLTGINGKISDERGKWKEIIIKDKTFPVMITYSASYLMRYPDNKKHSWEDLKKIRKKIQDLNINI